MTESGEALNLDLSAFREVVRHPRAHATILGQYRVGEYAGVVALQRLLGEMQPEGKLHTAMTIHQRDEDRHTRVFTQWIERLGVAPEPLPENVEGFFANSPDEFRQQRTMLEALPSDMRRIVVFAGINAIERLAFDQFDTHLRVLDRAEDREELERVIAEEKFHLSYVEHELGRQMGGEHAGFVTMVVEQARARFAEFSTRRRREAREAVERLLGAAGA